MPKITLIPALIKLVFLAAVIGVHTNTPLKQTIDAGHAKKKFTVGLLVYKGFDTSLVNFIRKETEEFYSCNVILLKAVPLPAFAFYAPRNRYKADSLLVFESRLVPAGIDAIAGLTHKDISTSKDGIPDWGVFGLGLCPGKACVVSAYRLQRGSKTMGELKERLIKVVLHEIGHNLGLPHCSNDPECLMTDAGGTIKQVDKERKWLCRFCRFKLG